ncbi:TetR/AcrR family transcriptional regulator [Bradyrhizobium prioriisuperbiae]|uniref:TetR/AcrR family transcriptional regulator n=1 Tax=Bradyrhizobium prioriisuperbiae TaxID=2854389 RepID=UPI0028ECDCA1|nr:TetR/AcrR family transcriptional regulator [Bradyrhizobium prioritasuperba]
MRASKRSDLLAAAGALIVRHGLDALTFDRLAAEAGVSKGGLLYHFPDKEQLLIALVEGRVARIDAATAAWIAAGTRRPGDTGGWLRAHIRTALSDADVEGRSPHALLGILRTALPPDAPARAALRAADGRWRDAARADGLPQGLATVITLAVAGAVVAGLGADDIVAVRETLLGLTET